MGLNQILTIVSVVIYYWKYQTSNKEYNMWLTFAVCNKSQFLDVCAYFVLYSNTNNHVRIQTDSVKQSDDFNALEFNFYLKWFK